MNLLQLFTSFYIRFRGDVIIPPVGDPEFGIFRSYANEAISNWATVPDLMWSQLWSSLQTSGEGDSVYTTTKTAYAAPSDMQRPGGFVRLTGTSSPTSQWPVVPVINPSAVQIQAFNNTYAYFTGDPNNGFICNIITGNVPASQSLTIDYPYYKQPTYFVNPTDVTEMPDPTYIIDWALAQRYLNTNLINKYQIMDASATQNLQDMINIEFSGTNYNGMKMKDPLGSGFGVRSSNIGRIRL